MESPLVKANKLMALALDPGAGTEEARTAAHAAVRLIHQHQLLKTYYSGSSYSGSYPPPPSYTPPPKAKPKPKPKPPPKPPPPPPLPRTEIRILAESKADRFIAFLVKKADVGEFPIFTAKYLTYMAVKNRELHPLNRPIFLYCIKQALKKRVKEGLIKSKTGPMGGYYIDRPLEDAN